MGFDGQDLAVLIERVVERFGLGRLAGAPARVAGGLSNEMWRVATSGGEFAVKRMVVNAQRSEFVGNVEAAFLVERRAWDAGVAMPEPVAEPDSGRALVREGGDLYRVHRWVDGRAGEGSAVQAAELLARIHAVGRPRWEGAAMSGGGWVAERWGAELAELATKVGDQPERMLLVDSHRDLDRKNTLLLGDGELLAVDWDAAGVVGAVQEAVGVALDWAGGDRGSFAEAIAAYRRLSGVVVVAEPWVFAGWVAALGGWLDYNADHRAGEELGRAEVVATAGRLRAIADELDDWVEALAA